MLEWKEFGYFYWEGRSDAEAQEVLERGAEAAFLQFPEVFTRREGRPLHLQADTHHPEWAHAVRITYGPEWDKAKKVWDENKKRSFYELGLARPGTIVEARDGNGTYFHAFGGRIGEEGDDCESRLPYDAWVLRYLVVPVAGA